MISAIGPTSAHTAWQAATDVSGVEGLSYEVTRTSGAGEQVVMMVGAMTSIDLSGLTPETNYAIRGSVTDAAGNRASYYLVAFTTSPAVVDPPTPAKPASSGDQHTAL